MNIQYIRDKYHVPAKRGLTVRDNRTNEVGRITGTPRSHVRLNIITSEGVRRCFHPFELDYLIDGKWVSGEELQAKYDGAWDRWNKRANELIAASRT